KKCKRMKHIFYKRYEELTDKQHWYLERYLGLSEDLRTAYGLKEAFRSWSDEAKNGTKDLGEIKQDLYHFYNQVEKSGMDEFIQAIGTLKNWQPEVLNSFAFGYNNGFVEGMNIQTKVIK
ncbi:Transposase, partial [Oceanobacillus limi]